MLLRVGCSECRVFVCVECRVFVCSIAGLALTDARARARGRAVVVLVVAATWRIDAVEAPRRRALRRELPARRRRLGRVGPRDARRLNSQDARVGERARFTRRRKLHPVLLELLTFVLLFGIRTRLGSVLAILAAVLGALAGKCYELATTQYGHHLLKCVLRHGSPATRARVLKELKGLVLKVLKVLRVHKVVKVVKVRKVQVLLEH